MISGVQRETVYVVILSVIGNGHCFPGLKLGLFPGNQIYIYIYMFGLRVNYCCLAPTINICNASHSFGSSQHTVQTMKQSNKLYEGGLIVFLSVMVLVSMQ